MNKGTLFGLLRWIAAAAAVVLLFSMLSQGGISSADCEEVAKAVTGRLDMSTMQQADSRMLRRLYGLDASQFDACVFWYPTTNMGAEELLIIKLQDVSQQEQVQAAISQRLATQKNSFEGYGVEQYDLLTNCAQVEVQGNYILFVVNAACNDAVDAFLQAL